MNKVTYNKINSRHLMIKFWKLFLSTERTSFDRTL